LWSTISLPVLACKVTDQAIVGVVGVAGRVLPVPTLIINQSVVGKDVKYIHMPIVPSMALNRLEALVFLIEALAVVGTSREVLLLGRLTAALRVQVPVVVSVPVMELAIMSLTPGGSTAVVYETPSVPSQLRANIVSTPVLCLNSRLPRAWESV
jgi:hypothetical protein